VTLHKYQGVLAGGGGPYLLQPSTGTLHQVGGVGRGGIFFNGLALGPI
jgi:hypothetical protein